LAVSPGGKGIGKQIGSFRFKRFLSPSTKQNRTFSRKGRGKEKKGRMKELKE